MVMEPTGRHISFEELTIEDQKLLKAARKTMERAYNPYSGFFVGAAALTQKGERVTGTNVETAAYGDSICAERVALLKANSLGYGNQCIAVAVITKNKDNPTTEVSAPCGSCRQMIYEFAQRSGVDQDFKIIMSTTDFDKIVVATIGDLLPMAFGPKDLGIGAENPAKIPV